MAMKLVIIFNNSLLSGNISEIGKSGLPSVMNKATIVNRKAIRERK